MDSSRKHLNAVPNLSPRIVYKSLSDDDNDDNSNNWKNPVIKQERRALDNDYSRWGIVKDVVSKEKDLQKQADRVHAEVESNSKSKLERDQLRRNRAEPGYLSKMAAIERQNSLVKQKGSRMDASIKGRDPFHNQMSNEAIEGGELRGKRIPEHLGGLGGGRRNPNPYVNDRERGVDSQRNRHQEDVGGSHLGTFDQEAYLSAQRMREGDGDKMRRFQFNQVISDATPPNRFLRDYRNHV